MQNRLFIFLILFGVTQHAEILSSSTKNRFAAFDEDSDSECTTNSKKVLNSSRTKESRFDSYKKSFANLAKSHRIALIQEINNDLDDARSDSDESTEDGIKFYFGTEHYSVHRELGLMVKTKHIKKTAEPKYVHNLEASDDTTTKFKGIILPANELKELLQREKTERPLHHAK